MARLTMTLLLAVILLPSLVLAAGIPPTANYHDDQRGTPRLLLGDVLQPEPAFDPGETAENYLRSNAPLFRIAPDLSGLQLAGEQESLLGKHYRYRQTLGGIPVMDAEIVVSVSLPDRRVYMVYNNTYPVENAPERPRLALSGEDALDAAWNHLRVHGELLEAPAAELVYVPVGADFRLAYRTHVSTTAPFGYWEHLVDAATGKILRFRAREVDGVNAGRVRKDMFDTWFGPVDSRGERTAEFLRHRFQRERKTSPSAVLASGTGKIFDPDPKSVLLSDTLTNTSPAAAFVGAYSDCELRDIALEGGVYRLDGPWVSIQDFEPPNTAPSTTTDGHWTAERDNNAFHDVMTYFHIDQNQRYLQSLGFQNIQHGPIAADSNGLDGEDQSHYIPDENRIAYGHGGVPDNEDADVILHEYWHAIQESVNPAWGGADTGAMGEGFGDYWASSYGYSKANGPVFHPDWAFHWDGHQEDTWPGRTHDKTTAQYDPTKTYPAHTEVNGVDGDELWGTPVWQAFRELRDTHARPREEMDRIVLQSNYGLGSGVRMPDMAAAMLAAAQSLYPDGPHAAVYLYHFRQNNIVPSPLQPETAVLSAEGCTAPNGQPDPGETVTYQLTIRNTGSSAMTNLIGALRVTDEVTSPSGPQVFGTIPAGGSATRSFTFTVGSTLACGSPLSLALDLQDGTTAYPSARWSLDTGIENVLAAQNFDAVTAPALPAGWSTAAVVGSRLWTTSTLAAHSTPNAAFIPDAAVRTDSHLDTAPMAISSADDRLAFYHLCNFEDGYDGGVLEISVAGAPFADIVAAGGSFTEGGYTGTIPTNYSNPIGGRDAWTSSRETFGRVVVVPPASAVGKSVVFRFRIGCDTGLGAEGWYIDDLRLSRWVCCEAPPVVPGDVDGDGVVGAADYGLLSLWLTQAACDDIREEAADLNHDGVVDVQDLVLLALML